jgi:hypothetical protein
MANIVQEQSRHVQEITLQNVYTSRNNTGASVPRHDGTQTIREEYVDPSIMANNFREQEIMQEQATAFVRIERSSTSTTCEYDSNHGSHAVGGTDAEAAQISSPHVHEINMQDLSSFRNNTATSMSMQNGHDRTWTINEEYVNPSVMANNSHRQVHSVHDVTMQEQATGSVRTERRPSTSTPCEYDSRHGSHTIDGTGANDVEAALTSNLDDEINHTEHSIILSGENEKPFTYFISMLAEWATRQDTQDYIQGKIKVH